jgi:hypothetical protein
MRNHLLTCFAITGLIAAVSIPALAQERDHDRDRDHGHDWERAHRVIGKAQEDLRRVEHRDMWTMVDKGHYDAAERNLADVRHDLDENRLDRGRLDRAIEQIEHITHVDRLDGHARDILAEDLHELRRLRDDWHWR